MDAARRRIDRRLKGIGIGRFQFRQLAPFEHLAGNRRAFGCELFEHRDVGRILPALTLLAALVAELVEQDVAELLGAAHGEFLSGHLVDFSLQPPDLDGEFFRQLRQPRAVHPDAFALHRGHHRDQRTVDPLVDARAALAGEARLERAVEPPGDVGILGGIGGGAVNRDFAEQDRLLASAAHVLERDRDVAQVALGELVHPVAAAHAVLAAPGIKIEADHHRVVDRRDVDADLGQHVHIILAVLEHLEDGLVFQQRLQRSERRVHGYLRGLLRKHIAPAVGKRDVAGVIRPQCEAHTDQIGADGIERSGLGIDRYQPRGAGAGDPVFKLCHGLHRGVGGVIDARHFGQWLTAAILCAPCPGGTRSGRLRRIEIGLARRTAATCLEPLQERGEAVLSEESSERLGRHGAELHLGNRLRQVAVLFQRHQHLAEFGIAPPFDQAVLQLGGLHVVRGIERRCERAVFCNKLRGRLGADAIDARHIVDCIAHQRQHIPYQFGGDAELLLDLGEIDALVLHRVEHIDARRAMRRVHLADQLHQILVGTDDGDVPAHALRFAGIGGDQVVRLQPGNLDARQAEGARGIADQRELRHQILGRFGTVGLVVLVNVVAEADPAGIEDYREVRRPVSLVEIGGELPQHRGVAIDRADRGAFRVGQRRQPVIGAKDIGRAIDEIEMLLAGCSGIGHAVC